MTERAAQLSFQAHYRRPTFVLDAAFDGGDGVTALFGPSGAGKTTILQIIAGIVRPEAGRVVVDGDVLTDTQQRIFVPPHQRRVGYVFQDAQLFPHLSVEQNINFATWFRRKDQSRPSFDEVVGVLGIGGLVRRRPSTLSGGEKQRVALARALLASPRILLMDEPLAGLDDSRRNEIIELIKRVRDEFKIPIVYVTHNRDEVRRLAARVVRLEAGRVIEEVSGDNFDGS
jgi:molybdate transport system ATP-binding protein